jgi:hypothetical protein
VNEIAEGARPDDLLVYRNASGVEAGRLQAEFRLAVATGGALEHFHAASDGAPECSVRQRIERVLIGDLHRIRRGTPWRDSSVAHFVELIEHWREPLLRTRPQRCFRLSLARRFPAARYSTQPLKGSFGLSLRSNAPLIPVRESLYDSDCVKRG